MRITSSRKEDILRRKAEWEADYNRRKAEHEQQYENYRHATYDAMTPTREALEKLMAKYPLLQSNVRVDEGRFGSPGISVRIDVNENNKFAENVSLSWDYNAYLDKDGEVLRETSSWSGMKAVTADQLADLEQSLNCLKELASLDWKALLNVTMPEWKDYIITTDPSYRDRPDFDKELEEAELEDIIGERKMIEVKPFSGSWYSDPNSRWARNPFIAIIKDSGSQYTIIEAPHSIAENKNGGEYFDRDQTRRVKKANIHLATPINIINV